MTLESLLAGVQCATTCIALASFGLKLLTDQGLKLGQLVDGISGDRVARQVDVDATDSSDGREAQMPFDRMGMGSLRRIPSSKSAQSAITSWFHGSAQQ